jgi:pimeloyl-ACP methyl ester carboxylesterase
MDYSPYSQVTNYIRLYKHFNGILRILTQKLDQLLRAGFDPNKGYIFGFSFGAQLVLRAARRFGDQRFKEVDVCDPAGPGFDLIRTTIDFRGVAKHVQCIHTSQSLGTVFSNLCHQDWRLGNCGINQDAAKEPPCGSHGLCPYFYNIAFTHDFKAIPKPKECTATNLAPHWPEDYKMGYTEAYYRKL